MASLSTGLAAVVMPVTVQAAGNNTLGAVLDTLLPDDGVSPPASALSIDVEMEQLIAVNPLLVRLFEAALGWLDGLEAVPFEKLSRERREDIMLQLQSADFNQIPGRFFHIIRALAVELYFARPEAIAGYPLNAAPQPAGYLPPWT